MAAVVYGPEYGFLKIDSALREREIPRVLKQASKLNFDISDDRLTNVLVAQYLAEIKADEDPELKIDLVAMTSYVAEYRRREAPTSLATRLIDARELYESFWVGDLPRNVPGWDDDLITVAIDLQGKSAQQIAVAVWAADRGYAKRTYDLPRELAPGLEFDHSLLGFGKFVPLTRSMLPTEPFFEVRQPIEGVCGVNRAWMYLESAKVDSYGEEIVDYYKRELPEWFEWIADVDKPLGSRPLGFHSLPLAAEAFARNLTIQEGAVFVFDQLAEIVKKNVSNAPFA